MSTYYNRIYIYIYVYECVCVCVWLSSLSIYLTLLLFFCMCVCIHEWIFKGSIDRYGDVWVLYSVCTDRVCLKPQLGKRVFPAPFLERDGFVKRRALPRAYQRSRRPIDGPVMTSIQGHGADTRYGGPRWWLASMSADFTWSINIAGMLTPNDSRTFSFQAACKDSREKGVRASLSRDICLKARVLSRRICGRTLCWWGAGSLRTYGRQDSRSSK